MPKKRTIAMQLLAGGSHVPKYASLTVARLAEENLKMFLQSQSFSASAAGSASRIERLTDEMLEKNLKALRKQAKRDLTRKRK